MSEHVDWFVDVTKFDGTHELVPCDDEDDARILVKRVVSWKLGTNAELVRHEAKEVN